MLFFPNCKINLGLYVTGKRPDGFHDLQTVFYPISIKDIIEIVPSDTFQFMTSGLSVEIPPEGNLCVKAYWLVKKDFPGLPPVKMWLHKHIPMGAGLGGGSADGAFTLKLLNEKFDLHLTTNQLLGYASELGSDCPFFVFNTPCHATGRGEILEPIHLDLSAFSLVLVHPEVHITTAWAFSQINPQAQQRNLKEIITHPIELWKDELKNDFEEPVLRRYPQLTIIKEKLYEAGAVYVSMTGSGSSFYGIFRSKVQGIAALLKDYNLTIL
ncbi:MAG TPA: 4-(cytidine 5'-diphospho)-2-C-methyl-D-erythritol kinase [Puia sp.]|jgi:4-diphosphocytidyl-2-C-methyl-D-erythritol kinase|nr:4-(cytidine 5'-diphospho)-2-C-methyl-D-erythritol kinase [Puia sp.]